MDGVFEIMARLEAKRVARTFVFEICGLSGSREEEPQIPHAGRSALPYYPNVGTIRIWEVYLRPDKRRRRRSIRRRIYKFLTGEEGRETNKDLTCHVKEGQYRRAGSGSGLPVSSGRVKGP